jgi:polar amino acid transport system substrate-binding protein
MRIRTKFATLAVAALFVASACSNSTPAAAGPKSLIAEIKARGELRIGVAAAEPWQTQDPKTGVWGGVFVDIMADYAQALGVKLTPVSTTFGNMIAGLQAGQFDIASSLNARPARAVVVMFSSAVASDIGSFAVTSSSLTTFDQINQSQNTVCVAQGSAEDLSLTTSKPKAQIQRLADESACRLAVQSGRANAIFDDWNGNGPFAKANPGTKLIFPPTPFVDEGIGYAITQNYSYADVAAINVEIQSFAGRGLLAASLTKWGAIDPVQFAAVPADVPVYVKTLESSQFPGG